MLCIRGGRIIDPATRVDTVGDLLIEDGRIRSVVPGGLESAGDIPVLDAAGRVVTPGFVDLHTHLRFPGFPDKETMESGTEAAAAGGFTTVCAMANTQPVVDRVSVVQQVLDEARRMARVQVRSLAAVSAGLQGEQLTDLPALWEAGAVAFSDDGKPVWNEPIMRQALAFSRASGAPISVHEEDPALVGRGVANAGVAARRLRLAEWPCRGEATMVARDVALLADCGGHLHLAHVSCRETVALLRAARERGLRLTAEVTPHHLTLTDELLEGDPATDLPPAHPCTKVNPPLRSPEDVQALVEALRDGTIDAVATDHAPHTRADKAGPYTSAAFGLIGLETALPLLLDLVRSGALDLVTAVERLTAGPARVFGMAAGTLRAGTAADVCIFDPDLPWRVQPEALRSRGKNTPLLGRELRGQVLATLVHGEIRYLDRVLLRDGDVRQAVG